MQTTDSKTINRRQFLRGDFRRKKPILRPPWAIAADDFTNACSRCMQCIDKCPENILVKAEDGFPTVNFELGGCSFCQQCVEVCDDAALLLSQSGQPAWALMAAISTDCISFHGVMCRSCADSCEEDAILFRHQLGSVSQPEINKKSCTACGFCVATCPVSAISIAADTRQEGDDYEGN
jgi:ferredoxin-type protein NapF